VARALLDHALFLASQLGGGATLTPDPDANRFVKDDSFAFLVAVVADMGIKAQRAWALPWELRQRVGHLDPRLIVTAPDLRRVFLRTGLAEHDDARQMVAVARAPSRPSRSARYSGMGQRQALVQANGSRLPGLPAACCVRAAHRERHFGARSMTTTSVLLRGLTTGAT
jgi:hypothetical protein